jgi:hypothetical protein
MHGRTTSPRSRIDCEAQQAWRDFLKPHAPSSRRIAASLLVSIAAFKPLIHSIDGRIRDFSYRGFAEEGSGIMRSSWPRSPKGLKTVSPCPIGCGECFHMRENALVERSGYQQTLRKLSEKAIPKAFSGLTRPPRVCRMSCLLIHRYMTLKYRGVAQPGSALAWGARGQQFESARPDQFLDRLRSTPEHSLDESVSPRRPLQRFRE